MSAGRDPGGRRPMVELQRRFSAARLALDDAWAISRLDREDAAARQQYLRALSRCQKLKEVIFATMAGTRRERSAA